jgi:hypothetical protein
VPEDLTQSALVNESDLLEYVDGNRGVALAKGGSHRSLHESRRFARAFQGTGGEFTLIRGISDYANVD